MIVIAATLLPGILIMYSYNKGFVLASPFGITILLALAITLPVYILNSLLFFVGFCLKKNSSNVDYEEALSKGLYSSGTLCFLVFYVLIIYINIKNMWYGSPPPIEHIVYSVGTGEIVFIAYVFLSNYFGKKET